MSQATIGSALVERRRELGLEKGQAADKIGMSRTTYSSYEQDAQRPSVDVFPALAGFLDVSMEELLTLYGATCVAAVRPTLEKVLSVHDEEVHEEPDAEGSPSRVEEPTPAPADALDEVHSEESLDSPGKVALERPVTASDRDVQSHESTDAGESKDTVVAAAASTLSDPDDHEVTEPERTIQPDELTTPRKTLRTTAFEPSTSIFKRELSDGTETYPDVKKKKKKKKKKKN
jgi:transcriptional regulator with XRE-family HTH domain